MVYFVLDAILLHTWLPMHNEFMGSGEGREDRSMLLKISLEIKHM